MNAPQIQYVGDPGPCQMYQQRPRHEHHAKRRLSHDEENWLNLKPKFQTPVQEGMVTPYGRAPAFHTMAFRDRHTELSWLIQTQQRELANLHEEMRANGLPSTSLSTGGQGEDDEDLEAANYSERNLRFVPYKLDPETQAALTRRIEWERYIIACGGSNRIYAAISAKTGNRVITCTDRRERENLANFVPKLLELLGDRDITEIENARDRAAHYKSLVWSLLTPDQQLAWTKRTPEVRMYIDCADSNVERQDWPIDTQVSTGGPQELRFHGDGGDIVIEYEHSGFTGENEESSSQEPTEFDLWPMTEEEREQGIQELEVSFDLD